MYFGSVRFFKNLILLCVIVMIAVPAVFAVRSRASLGQTEEEVTRLSAEVEQLRLELEQERSKPAPTPAPTSPSTEPEVSSSSPEAAEPVFSAEPPEYQALYPDFYAPQPLVEQTRTDKMIYLTFDDGPTANTDKVLRVLAEKDVKATFFINGHTSPEAMRRMRDIVDQGHTLGMHSFAHDYATIYDSVEAYLDDMYLVFSLIREATGETPTVFRFPGGSINSYNSHIYQELLSEMLRRGFVPHDWNMSAQDATSTPLSVETVIDNVLTGAAGKERGFVLMHDGASRHTTAQALGPIIDRLRDMGFQFDRIRPDTKPILFSYLE